MYCPKCGGELEPRWSPWHERALLHCPRGDMGLSPAMQDALEARYDRDAPQSPLPPFSRQLHGGIRWFCPGCGRRLDAHLACPSCGRHLRDLAYHLIELHPHGPLPPTPAGR